MRRAVLEAYHRELLDALNAEIDLEPEWVAASDSSDGAAHLTLDEFRELDADLAAVREKWWGRGREPREGRAWCGGSRTPAVERLVDEAIVVRVERGASPRVRQPADVRRPAALDARRRHSTPTP